MSELIPLFALWEQKSKRSGNTYYSGKINNVRVLMFPSKSTNPKAPAFNVVIAPPLEGDQPPAPPLTDAELDEKIPF